MSSAVIVLNGHLHALLRDDLEFYGMDLHVLYESINVSETRFLDPVVQTKAQN